MRSATLRTIRSFSSAAARSVNVNATIDAGGEGFRETLTSAEIGEARQVIDSLFPGGLTFDPVKLDPADMPKDPPRRRGRRRTHVWAVEGVLEAGISAAFSVTPPGLEGGHCPVLDNETRPILDQLADGLERGGEASEDDSAAPAAPTPHCLLTAPNTANPDEHYAWAAAELAQPERAATPGVGSLSAKPRAYSAWLALKLGEAIRAGETERALALLDELLAVLAARG